MQTVTRRAMKIEQQIIALQAVVTALNDYWEVLKQDVAKLSE